MSATIESLHGRFLINFDAIVSLYDRIIAEVSPSFNNSFRINLRRADALELQSSYLMTTSDIIASYYTSGAGLDIFKKCVLEHNFAAQVTSIIANLRSLGAALADSKPINSRAALIAYIVKQTAAMLHISALNTPGLTPGELAAPTTCLVCDSGPSLQLSINTSHYICNICGEVTEISGSEYERNLPSAVGANFISMGDKPAQSQSGSRFGRRSQKPDKDRHFNKCLSFLLAEKECPITDAESDLIRAELRLCSYSSVYCAEMRKVLKNTGLTKYNPFVPWLIKHFTGSIIPALSEEDKAKIKSIFNQLRIHYEQLRVTDHVINKKENLSYYYFFIYKIIEKEFAKTNKAELLRYIHLQSRETIIKNDALLAKITEAASSSHAANKPPKDLAVYDLVFCKTRKWKK
jgi:hypothetical protein